MTSIEKKQQEMIKYLSNEVNRLRKEIKGKNEDIAFLKRLVIASLEKVPNHKVVLFDDVPEDGEFVQEENESDELIVTLKGRK